MNTETTTEQKLSLRWIYLAWVGVTFCSVVIGIISAVVQCPPEPIAAQLGISNFSIFAIVLYSLGTIISVVVLLLLIRSKRMGMSSIGFSGSLTFQGVFYALIGLVAAFILYPSIEAILQPIGIKMLWRGDASSVLRLKSTVDILLILSNAVLLGPIAEEIIFRGYVFTAFKQARQNILSAYILSAIVFASAHIAVGPGTIIFIFFWSFIPAFLYLKFGNLYPAILFHILNNFVTYVVFPLWIL